MFTQLDELDVPGEEVDRLRYLATRENREFHVIWRSGRRILLFDQCRPD